MDYIKNFKLPGQKQNKFKFTKLSSQGLIAVLRLLKIMDLPWN